MLAEIITLKNRGPQSNNTHNVQAEKFKGIENDFEDGIVFQIGCSHTRDELGRNP